MKFQNFGGVVVSAPVAEKLAGLMLAERQEAEIIHISKDPRILEVFIGGRWMKVSFPEPLRSLAPALARPFHAFKAAASPHRGPNAPVVLEREFKELVPRLEQVFQYALTDNEAVALRAVVFAGASTKQAARLLSKSDNWTLNMIRRGLERIAQVTWAEVKASEGQHPIMRVPEFLGLPVAAFLWKAGLRTLEQAAKLGREGLVARTSLGERSLACLRATLPRYGLALAEAELTALAAAVAAEAVRFRAEINAAAERVSQRCHTGLAETRAALLKELRRVLRDSSHGAAVLERASQGVHLKEV